MLTSSQSKKGSNARCQSCVHKSTTNAATTDQAKTKSKKTTESAKAQNLRKMLQVPVPPPLTERLAKGLRDVQLCFQLEDKPTQKVDRLLEHEDLRGNFFTLGFAAQVKHFPHSLPPVVRKRPTITYHDHEWLARYYETPVEGGDPAAKHFSTSRAVMKYRFSDPILELLMEISTEDQHKEALAKTDGWIRVDHVGFSRTLAGLYVYAGKASSEARQLIATMRHSRRPRQGDQWVQGVLVGQRSQTRHGELPRQVSYIPGGFAS